MKQIFLLFLIIIIAGSAFAQGVTKNGQISSTGSVNKNGQVGASSGVNKNGQIITASLSVGDSYQGGKIFYFLFPAIQVM